MKGMSEAGVGDIGGTDSEGAVWIERLGSETSTFYLGPSRRARDSDRASTDIEMANRTQRDSIGLGELARQCSGGQREQAHREQHPPSPNSEFLPEPHVASITERSIVFNAGADAFLRTGAQQTFKNRKAAVMARATRQSCARAV